MGTAAPSIPSARAGGPLARVARGPVERQRTLPDAPPPHRAPARGGRRPPKSPRAPPGGGPVAPAPAGNQAGGGGAPWGERGPRPLNPRVAGPGAYPPSGPPPRALGMPGAAVTIGPLQGEAC